MSVSLPGGEINERLPGERRVEAEAGIQGAPVSRAKAVRAQEIQIEVEPATPHPPHPFSYKGNNAWHKLYNLCLIIYIYIIMAQTLII